MQAETPRFLKCSGGCVLGFNIPVFHAKWTTPSSEFLRTGSGGFDLRPASDTVSPSQRALISFRLKPPVQLVEQIRQILFQNVPYDVQIYLLVPMNQTIARSDDVVPGDFVQLFSCLLADLGRRFSYHLNQTHTDKRELLSTVRSRRGLRCVNMRAFSAASRMCFNRIKSLLDGIELFSLAENLPTKIPAETTRGMEINPHAE